MITHDVAAVGLARELRTAIAQQHSERRRDDERRDEPQPPSTSSRRAGGAAAAPARARRSSLPGSSNARDELAFEQLVHQCTSSSACAQRLPRGVERGADRARADRERCRDRGVVEVGVVVEKDDLALPLGEQVERQHRRVPVRRRLVRLGERGPAPARVACRVDDDPPDPRLERAAGRGSCGACAQRSRTPPARRRSRAPGRPRSRRRRGGTPAAGSGRASRARRASVSTTRGRPGILYSTAIARTAAS